MIKKIEYKDCCHKCGIRLYLEKRKDALVGIGVSIGKCPICKKDNVGVIPARDWQYRAGLFEKYI